MVCDMYRYQLNDEIAMTEVKETLALAVLVTECLHGAAQTRLEGAHQLEMDDARCVIDASTEAGRDLNRIFAGLLQHEFGQHAFHVHRVEAVQPWQGR